MTAEAASGGRQKGTPNKATKETRELIKAFVEANIPALQSKFDAIENPKEWVEMFIKVMQYAVPKMADVHMDINKDFIYHENSISTETKIDGYKQTTTTDIIPLTK